jgi:hypothetical protein
MTFMYKELKKYDSYSFSSLRHLQKGLVWGVRGIIGPRFVMIVEPSCVEHILKTNFENYIKGKKRYPRIELNKYQGEHFVERMQIFLGNGIFNTNGASWKKQRYLPRVSHQHFRSCYFIDK